MDWIRFRGGTMRPFFGLLGLFILFALVGCGSGGGANSVSSPDLTGRWATALTIPGSGTQLTLQTRSAQVTGTGAYQIEAGRSGTLTVTGTTTGNTFQLN